MILAFLSRIPAIVWVVLAMCVLGMLLIKQYQQNEYLRIALETAQQERSHAETEKARLIESDRKHARALADARAKNTDLTRKLLEAPNDGCLDLPLPSAVRESLRVQPKGRKADAPSASRPKAHAAVQRDDLPRRPDPHPGTPRVGDAVRGRQDGDP